MRGVSPADLPGLLLLLKLGDTGGCAWQGFTETPRGRVGTQVTMAPEVARGDQHSHDADCYSIGATCLDFR